MHLLAVGWNPLVTFLMLDYFSRGYLGGPLLAVIYGVTTLLRVIKRYQPSRSSVTSTHLSMAKVQRNLNSLFSLGVILASACFANQILNVLFTYMVGRFTDANPAYALQQAWHVSQLVACLLLLLHAMRWCVFAVLDRDSQEASLPTSTTP
jgi:hypothetical protein